MFTLFINSYKTYIISRVWKREQYYFCAYNFLFSYS